MIDTDALWQAAYEYWPEIDRDKTYLIFTEMRFVESLVLKEKLPGMEISLAGAILSITDLTGNDTGLSLDERFELLMTSSSFEMERITLEPIGEFMMGYGPRADLLTVQVQEAR